MSLHVIILAAGKGTRMKSNVPKVLHCVGGKPLLTHVIETAQTLQPAKIHIIYGADGDMVRAQINHPHLNWIQQQEQLGTGHAVMQALPHLNKATQILILYGDVPLITATTLQKLIANTPCEGFGILSALLPDPTGFGRIIRDATGKLIAIVEQKDASPQQQKIAEINTGIMITSPNILQQYLPHLKQQNAQHEYYLTDLIALLHTAKKPLYCMIAEQPEETYGVNTKQQLAQVERRYQNYLATQYMLCGLTLMDPARFDVRGTLTFEENVIIDTNVIIEGDVTLGANTVIGPNSFLKNVKARNNVQIKANCFLEGVTIADNCVVGPFARIRPHTVLAEGAHIGNFIEVKNTTLGTKTKAHHVGYLGDTKIGNNVNIGAGTITCNYDGAKKHVTHIADNVFVGSNTSLVAPVTLETDAVIGAGSVITQDAPATKLTIARSRQITIENWPRKKG